MLCVENSGTDRNKDKTIKVDVKTFALFIPINNKK